MRRLALRTAPLLAALALLVACGGLAAPTPEPVATSQDLVARTAATARAAARPDADASSPSPSRPDPAATRPEPSRPPDLAATRPADPAATRPADPAATRPMAAGGPTPRSPSPAPATPPRSPTSLPRSPTPAPTAPPVRPAAPPSPTAPIAFPKDRTLTYVAIGASDTVGLGAANPARDGWVPQLHRRLPAGSRLVNLGVSGAKLSEAVQTQLPKAIEARPDLVTVWNVVNDLNANVDMAAYERDLERLLRELTGKTGARVLIGNVPDLSRVPAYTSLGIPPEELRKEAGRWNQVIARVAQKYPGRVYVVDLYARSAEIEIDETLVAGDDFHPSAKGYGKLADVFWDHMVAGRLVAPT